MFSNSFYGAAHLIPLVFHCVVLVVEQRKSIHWVKESYGKSGGYEVYTVSKFRLSVDHLHPDHPTRAASLDSVKEKISNRNSHDYPFEAHP